MLEKLARTSEDYDGKKIVIPINKARNGGLGGAAEDGTLPTASNQGYVDATYTPAAVYGRVRLTGHSMRRAKTNAGSFARTLDREIRGMERDFKNDVNRILNGKGDEILTLINGAATAAQQTVDSTRFINEGDTLQVATDDVTVQTVDSETLVTFTASFTSADNDTVKRRIGAALVVEPDGIQNVIDDTGTFGAIARATNFFWQATVIDAGTAAPLTLALMDQLVRNVEKRTNQAPDSFYSDHLQRDKYGQLLQVDQRYVNTQRGDGGMTKLSHKDVPFLTDLHAPEGMIFAPTWSSFGIVEASPIDWMDDDGAVLSRVADKDAYEATLVYEFQTVGYNCRENGLLKDLATT